MATDASAAAPGGARRLGEVWAGMTVVNRLTLAGIAVAILLALIALVTSGRRDTSGKVPLLEGYKFTASEMQEAIRAFGPTRTDYEIQAGQIYVPRSKESDYLSALAAGNAYPENFYKAFDDYVTNERTWWSSQADAQRQIFMAKQRILAKMISSFPEIGEASVVVTDPPTMGMRRTGPRKATVRVTMLGRVPLSPLRVEEIKHMVASSFEGLEPGAVYVAGDALLGKAGAGGMSGDACVDTTLAKLNNPHLQSKESYAECIEHDILRMLGHLEGVSVVANVEVDLDKRIDQRIKQFEKGTVVSRDTTTRSSETAGGAGRGAEPGVRTNVDEPGVAPNQGASAGGGGGNVETDETSREEMVPNTIETTKEIAGLTPKKVGVVISLPRRYLEPGTDDAGNNTPAAITEAEIVANVVALGYPGLTEDGVKLVRYTPAELPPMAVAGFSTIEFVGDYGSSIFYGLLGLAAIIVAIVIARRAPVPAIDRATVEPAMTEEEEASLLPELPADEEAARFGKMQETVNTMVSSSPESAASLVRRWIQQDEP